MIITDKEEVYNKIKLMRSHGMTVMSYQRASGHATSYDIVNLGYNYRMDDIRASIGIVQLDRLKDDLEKRAKVREWYCEKLDRLDSIVVPFGNREGFVSNYIFPIVLKDSTAEKRDVFRKWLHENGIQTSVHYPAIHRFSAYRDFSGKLPYTEYVTDNEVTLPMYAKLQKSQIEYICDKVAECASI